MSIRARNVTVGGDRFVELTLTLFCSGYLESNGVLFSEHYNCGKTDHSGSHYYTRVFIAPLKQYFAVGIYPDGTKKYSKKTIQTNRGPIDCSVSGFSQAASKFKWRKKEERNQE